MLSTRLKLFREYNSFTHKAIAEAIGIDEELYRKYEDGSEIPTIDIIVKLAECYKVTTDEFYGYTPRLELYSPSRWEEASIEEFIPDAILKLSELSWDEKQLVLYYRRCNSDKKEELIKTLLEGITD